MHQPEIVVITGASAGVGRATALLSEIEFAQAKNFTRALLRGQPDRGDIVKTLLEDQVRELI